jgi:AraC-like DNA-binding protein
VPADDVLQGTGTSLESLRDPTTRLTFRVYEMLVERARRLTSEPGLAFVLGFEMRLSWHGFLGFAAMTAGTLGEALAIAERFIGTRAAALRLSSYVEGDKASLVLEEHLPDGPLREFTVITLLVGLSRIGDALTGKELPGLADCALPEPPYAAPFVALAAASGIGTMRFGQPAHRLVFDAADLGLPIVSADPVATALARAQCDRELAALAEASSLAGRVRAAVARADRAPPSLEQVAKALHVSGRTLKRRLGAEGTSFSTVLEEVRRQRALLLLEDRRLGIAEVATRLGYSDVANFTRAFRRWTGATPASFRRRCG